MDALLKKATTADESPTPGYVYVELGKLTLTDLAICDKMADWLAGAFPARLCGRPAGELTGSTPGAHNYRDAQRERPRVCVLAAPAEHAPTRQRARSPQFEGIRVSSHQRGVPPCRAQLAPPRTMVSR